MVRDETSEALVDCIYDAAGNSDRWQTALERALLLFKSYSAEIGHIDLADGTFSFFVSAGGRYTEERIDHYRLMMAEDPRLIAMSQRPFMPIHCRMVVSDDQLHASRLYKELLAPNGIEYTLGVNLVEERKSVTFFTTKRGPEQPAFDDGDCRLLADLVPHLRRALRLHSGFAELELLQMRTLEALDQIPLGVFIVRQDGTFVMGNRMGTELAAARAPLLIVNGKLSLSDGEAARLLRKTLRTVMSEAGGPPGVLVVDRPDEMPLRLLVTPLTGRAGDKSLLRQRGDLVVIYANDPSQSHEAPWERLQHMFGLSPSEAKLVAGVVAGRSVVEVGSKLGLTPGSARQYFKNILAKTGTHSQGELLRLILQSPAWIRASTS